jgi:suppressor of ftsI
MKNIKILILAVIGFFCIGYFYFNNSNLNFSNTKITNENETQIVELKNGDIYNLTAEKIKKTIGGKEQTMLAYNGSIPGPTIKAVQGSEITINFKNKTDENQLLHSHGVRLDNQFDGSQLVQKEILPGESFTYKIKFPDAGIYWYHPHVDEVVDQVLGLYGAFLVVPKNENYFPKVNSEDVVFLSDLPFANGQIQINQNDHALMGHYGNVMLVNGKENFILTGKTGEVKRFYLVNSANARPFNFTIPNAKMKLIGSDNGAYEKASFVNNIIIAPSERYIVDVYFPSAGEFIMQNKTPISNYNLGKIVIDNQQINNSYLKEFNNLEINQEVVNDINSYAKYFSNPTDYKFKLTIAMGMGMGNGGNMNAMMMGSMMNRKSSNDNSEMVELMGMQLTREQAIEHCKSMPEMQGCEPFLTTGSNTQTNHQDGIEWEDTMAMMNNMSTKKMVQWKIVDEATGKENMDINLNLNKDKPTIFEFYNDPNSMHPMQHPIHFHGERFLVLERNGIKETNLAWKDTTLIKTGERVKILLDNSNPGIWMAHCHIAEHLANGMMFNFTVK